MTVVVGYQPERGGDEALELGIGLATNLATSLAVITIAPRPWDATPSGAEKQFTTYSQRHGAEAKAAAKAHIAMRAPQLKAEYYLATHRSVSSALAAAAVKIGADALVLSAVGGKRGKLSLGSTTSRLAHSSEVPVALAPQGFRLDDAKKFSRISCAFTGTSDGEHVVVSAAALSIAMSIPLRLVTFGVTPADMFPPEVGFSTENQIRDAWAEQVFAAQRAACAKLPPQTQVVDGAVGTGRTWDDAVASVPSIPGELLCIGTRPRSTVKQVFVGSQAGKIIAASSIPVIALPA